MNPGQTRDTERINLHLIILVCVWVSFTSINLLPTI